MRQDNMEWLKEQLDTLAKPVDQTPPVQGKATLEDHQKTFSTLSDGFHKMMHDLDSDETQNFSIAGTILWQAALMVFFYNLTRGVSFEDYSADLIKQAANIRIMSL